MAPSYFEVENNKQIVWEMIWYHLEQKAKTNPTPTIIHMYQIHSWRTSHIYHVLRHQIKYHSLLPFTDTEPHTRTQVEWFGWLLIEGISDGSHHCNLDGGDMCFDLLFLDKGDLFWCSLVLCAYGTSLSEGPTYLLMVVDEQSNHRRPMNGNEDQFLGTMYYIHLHTQSWPQIGKHVVWGNRCCCWW